MLSMTDDEMVADFRAFVASKPQDETYDYESVERCAFSQYLKHHGIDDARVLVNVFCLGGMKFEIPNVIATAVGTAYTGEHQQLHTWQSLLERLDAALM